MSKILMQCDGCLREQIIPVRQAHQARHILAAAGWTQRDRSSRFGGLKEDYCEKCS